MPEQKPAEEGGKEGRRRIDLSVAQVAASALATVVGALLASELGVYGTILGAAVVSVGATTGGAVFQHIFRRTGEQLREAVDRTGPGPAVNGLRQEPDSGPPVPVAVSAEWNEPQVVRARRRWTWKSYAAMSALVFVLAMTPILAFELATGQPVSATVKGESGSGTSLGGTVAPKPSAPPAGEPSTGPSGLPSQGAGGASPSPSAGKGGAASEPAAPGGSPDAGGSGKASPSAGPSGTSSAEPSAGSSAGPSGAPSTPAGPASEPAGTTAPQPPAPSGAPAGASPAAAAPTGSAAGR
ncbi:hypothetical protein [Kitasatospora sp. NPDC091207]|uniref:hypothetical protein n=1 Tax=Kitasatospora sp. NPDC091207 TaxID=3364083 RepID=UPI0037FB7E31